MKAAFYKGTRPGLAGLYNRFVRWWTCGKYSHMELVFSDGQSASSSWLDGGVRFKYIIFDSNWDVVQLPASWEASARAWFTAHEGKAYDYWAEVRFCFGFVRASSDKYMCSESCMAALDFTESWRFEPNLAGIVVNHSSIH